MSKYAALATKGQPNQREPIDPNQVRNNAGGYIYELDDFARLDRFLILGSDANTYYQSAKTLTRESAACVLRCYDADRVLTVRQIVLVSTNGRAPKNDPAIFALALGAVHADETTSSYAFAAVPRVCRTATHLFMFVGMVLALTGKAHMRRALRRAVRNWYSVKPVDKLAYQMIKYREREGFSHHRMMQMAHPSGLGEPARIALYRWARGLQPADLEQSMALPVLVKAHLWAMNQDQAPAIGKGLIQLVERYRLPWEAIPTSELNNPEIWKAMLPTMGLTAMIRELARMTQIGALKPLEPGVIKVVERLRDEEELRGAKLHPFNLLLANAVYKSGRSVKGNRSWTPIGPIVDSLETAFYASFKTVWPTGKRILIGLDVSGSMAAPLMGSPLTVCEGAAALAMTTIRTEQNWHVMAFDCGMRELPLTSRMSLNDVLKYTRDINGGGTDCALPMLYAMQHGLLVDAFVVITDNETWAGREHPTAALHRYRQHSGIAAKLVVIGMTSTGFSIADPNDAGMLDVVGFDSSAPAVIADFIRG